MGNGVGIGSEGDPSPTLTGVHVPGVVSVMKADGFCKYNESGVAGPLRAVGQDNADVDLVLAHGQANHEAPIVFRKAQKAHDPDDHERWEESEVSGTLNGQGDTAGMVAMAFNATQDPINGPIAGALSDQGAAVLTSIPRRLTPTECERLQGFPDGWTRLKDDGTELADSPRYRMMGNAVTVNVAEWIGKRIIGQEKG